MLIKPHQFTLEVQSLSSINMLPYSANLVCFALCLMTGSSFGKTVEIELTSDPQEVQTLKTKELTLECDIATVTSRSSQVEDVDYIESIEITDSKGDKVVSIQKGQREPFIRYKGFGDKGATATASVGLPTGFLHLKVPNPDQSNTCDSATCKYTCTGTVYKTDTVTPAIIHAETTVTWKETPNNELVDIVYNIKNEMLENINNDIVNNNKEIVNVNNEMVKKQEITQGFEDCTPPNVKEYHRVFVNFGRTYAKPPRVFTSYRYSIGASSGGVYGHNNIAQGAELITTTGFWLTCYSYNKMYGLTVYWIAFPSA